MVRAVAVGWEKGLSLQVEEPQSDERDKSFSREARPRSGRGQAPEREGQQDQKYPCSSDLIRVQNDLPFSASLRALRETGFDFDLKNETPFARNLTIPWDLVDRESHDRGCYIIVLHLPRDRKISVGGLGEVKFRKGYYLYVGSARKDLSKRIERHRRLTKKQHWHIDCLRGQAEFAAAIPIRTSADLECRVADSLGTIADWTVPGFGSSDCSCKTHLFGMEQDPVHQPEFSKVLLYYRMGMLEEELDRELLPEPQMNTDGLR